jgi:hypothetical protein
VLDEEGQSCARLLQGEDEQIQAPDQTYLLSDLNREQDCKHSESRYQLDFSPPPEQVREVMRPRKMSIAPVKFYRHQLWQAL